MDWTTLWRTLLWASLALNLASATWHILMVRRLTRLNALLVLICIEAFKLRRHPRMPGAVGVEILARQLTRREWEARNRQA